LWGKAEEKKKRQKKRRRKGGREAEDTEGRHEARGVRRTETKELRKELGQKQSARTFLPEKQWGRIAPAPYFLTMDGEPAGHQMLTVKSEL
jgi:hypothetical protein